jgi:hypothetical protein
MRRTQFRQVARLEQLLRPYLKRTGGRRQSRAEFEAFTAREAFIQVANLSFIILFGKPKIDENLICAWARCRESSAWQAHLEIHGNFPSSKIGRPIDEYAPFNGNGAYTAEYFRECFLPDLPGPDEAAKLNAILERAPSWLLWFCYADVSAHVLGLKLPDLSKCILVLLEGYRKASWGDVYCLKMSRTSSWTLSMRPRKISSKG